MIAPRIHNEDGRIMRPSDIITDMKQMYGIQMLYSKAYESLKYALSLTYGTHDIQIKERHLDYISLCADYYKKEVLIDAYSIPIMPVGHPSSWVVPEDIRNHPVIPPDI